MSLLCRVLGHRARPSTQLNQGFAFSVCQRCNRDMIRSAGAPSTSKWKQVPAGFRVSRKPFHHRSVRMARPAMPRPRSTMPDMVQIGMAALFWHVQDILGTPPSRRTKVLRIPLL